MRYRYFKVTNHHYFAGTPPQPTKPLPTYFEVMKDGRLGAFAWFWNEADAKEVCDVMNGRATPTVNTPVNT